MVGKLSDEAVEAFNQNRSNVQLEPEATLQTPHGELNRYVLKWRIGFNHLTGEARFSMHPPRRGGEGGLVQTPDPLEEIELSGRSSRLASRSP